MKPHFLALLICSSICFGDVVQHRGVWLHPREFGSQQLVDETINRVAAAHLNVVYPLVWYYGGTASFHSKLAPMARDLPKDFDPLGALVKTAHARGIQVHAWFVNGSYGSSKPGEGLFEQHPDWQLQSGRGGEVWYDLGKPEVRDYQRDLMLDCLKNYDIDGLHFDYIRYAGQTICFCDHCQKEFARKYGFRPVKPSEERFPALLDIGANPLAKPTTAKVLATFDDGVPAITVNKLGEGEAVLVNWNAGSRPSLAVDNFVVETLKRFEASAKNMCQLHTTQTAAKYDLNHQTQTASWLKEIGFPTKRIDESSLTKIPKGGTLILAGQYLISEETTKELEEFVRAGGHCLFLDGPVMSIKFPSLQRVVGLAGTARYFRELKVVSPSPDQDLLKSGPPVDVAKERNRMEKWVEYRKWTVTELVRAVYKGAKKIKPRAWVNAAVFYKKEAADKVCQDWYGWLQEGCIDYVLPMAYTEKNDELAKAFAEWRASDKDMTRIIPGLSIYSKRDSKAIPRDLDLVRSQLEMCRENGSHGNLFFSLAFLNEDLIKFLASGPFAEPARAYYPKASLLHTSH